jgi:hypothetical protein
MDRRPWPSAQWAGRYTGDRRCSYKRMPRMRQLKLELRGDRDVPIDGKAHLFGSRSMGTPCAQTRVSEWATHDGEGEQGAMPRAYLLLCGQEPTVTRSRAPSTSALQPMTSPPTTPVWVLPRLTTNFVARTPRISAPRALSWGVQCACDCRPRSGMKTAFFARPLSWQVGQRAGQATFKNSKSR